MALFTSICLPSVRSQTPRHPFRWVIVCDDGYGSPDWFRVQISECLAGRAEIVWARKSQAFTIRSIVANLMSSVNAEMLLTTRLDNDDAIARGFLDRVQDESTRSGGRVMFFNFPVGLQLHGGSLLRIVDPSSAFLTLAEPIDDKPPITVHATKHSRVIDTFPVRQLPAGPMWLQSIHGNNKSNAAWGWPVRSRAALEPFDINVQVTDSLASLAVGRMKAVTQLAIRVAEKPSRVRRIARSWSR